MTTRILLAEDEDLIRGIAKLALEKCGFEVQAVSDGRACFEALLQSTPDLLLLDLGLPIIGGLEVLEKMDVLGFSERFPVAVFTAHTDSEMVRKAIKLGVLDYIVKPFDAKALGRRVSDLIFKPTETELRIMLANLRMSDQSLLRAVGISKWSGRGLDPYPTTDNNKTICVLLPSGQSPQLIARLPFEDLVKKIIILRKCIFGYQTVWPTPSVVSAVGRNKVS